MTTLHARHAMLPDDWGNGITVRLDAAGGIAGVEAGATASGDGVLLPGLANCHGHAFQRAMAGRAEVNGPGPDTFWTWREQMYALAGATDPAALEAIATLVYVEMLEAGYTSVCEFHYLHHGPGGVRHADPAAASRALLRAAAATGIRLTLLPVLYMHGGFGGRAPEPAQLPFVHDVHGYLGLLESLRDAAGPTTRVGIAFHSLRAVTERAMEDVLDWRADALPDCPVHIHVAEQLQEVHECEAWSGHRPVDWLLSRGWVDSRWCLVHATHLSEEEVRWLAATGAVAGLCPTTEANLGDGIFPLEAYLAEGGRLAIGSDSHVSVSPVEELRWLEYGQRLTVGRRSVAATDAEPHCGARLVRAALAGGREALGQDCGRIAPGAAADLVELDGAHPLLAGATGDELLDRWVFSGNRPLVRNAWVAGRQVVRDGRHPLAAEAAAAFAALAGARR